MKRYSLWGAMGAVVILVSYFLYQGKEARDQLQNGIAEIGHAFSSTMSGDLIDQTPEEVRRYGIEANEDYYICTDKVKPNENVSSILARFDMAPEVIHELATKSREVFDLRNIRPGKHYCIMRSSDSTSSVRYFIYEQDPINYVVYQFGDSVSIRTGQREVEIREREASGRILSSLWTTMVENDLDPQMAIKLSEIYAWSIDFYHIQKNDAFKVLFEEKYVDGKRIGLGEIKAVWFSHAGRDFYAIRFEHEDVSDWFDDQANSLRKAFLKAPLKYSRISSRYNPKRFHPVLKRVRAHLGTDYAAPTGTPILSVGDGVVVEAQYKRNNGNYVKIRHNGTYTTQYLHMSKIAPGMKVGRAVKQGEVIGYVGSTGLATGPHLCYRFWKNGVQIDPFKEEIPPSEPIRKEHMTAYEAHKASVVSRLEAIPLSPAQGDTPQADEEEDDTPQDPKVRAQAGQVRAAKRQSMP